MVDLGVFQRNQTIKLELIINNDEFEVKGLDSAPTATITYTNGLRNKSVSNVTLEKGEIDTFVYNGEIALDEKWFYGAYLVTYFYIIDGQKYTEEQSFSVSSEVDFAKQKEDYFQSLVKDIENDDYVPSYTEKEDVEVIAAAHEVHLIFSETPKYNYTYKVIVDGVKSVTGEEIKKEIVLEIDSQFKPLYSDPNEVKGIIMDVAELFTAKEYFIAIRNASQKAMIYLQQVADPNNSRYKIYKETSTPYFSMTKFVANEAAYNLIQNLISKFLKGTIPYLTNPDDVQDNTLGTGFTLGDFSVTNAGEAGKKEMLLLSSDEFFRKINPIIKRLKADVIYWRDDMMTRGRRGYTSAKSGSYRSDAGSPESRDF